MSDPFDDLEHQLRRRVTTNQAPRRHWWRSHRVAAVLLVAGLGGSGAALAAGGLRGPGDEQRGRSLAWAVITDTARQPACSLPKSQQDGPVTVVDAATPRTVLQALPWMRQPAAPSELARGLKLLNSRQLPSRAPVVRSTVRLVRLDARWQVLIRLERGAGVFEVQDAAACQDLRRHMLGARIASERPGVKDWAQRRLAMDTSANPGAHTLAITLISRNRTWVGIGIPLLPGPGTRLRHEVPRGALLNGPQRAGQRTYVGLADPGVARLRVWSKRPDVRATLPGSVPVRHGFWLLELPRGTGPVRLTETGPDGRKGRVVRLR